MASESIADYSYLLNVPSIDVRLSDNKHASYQRIVSCCFELLSKSQTAPRDLQLSEWLLQQPEYIEASGLLSSWDEVAAIEPEPAPEPEPEPEPEPAPEPEPEPEPEP